MPAIRLTDEATDMLKSYYWQGNVRQLKNVAEQISIIEQRREITPDILAHYLPAHQMHRGLAVVGHAQQEMSMEERTMLYNMMGAMKREINMLKEQVELLLKNNDPRTPIGEEIVAWEQGQVLAPTDEMVEPEMAQEVTIVAPAKELKLSDLERETIRQALERNGGNRKAAAAELGLSERTLYRKIKEYEL
jgi:DNA-binding NtrC family response regulator